MNILLLVILVNWLSCLTLSWIYVLWLWLVSGDIKLEGWAVWRHTIPIARFRLISTKSWYAKLWQQWYGFALMFAMIHRDEKGQEDDNAVEQTIVHEAHHVVRQIIPLGMMFWVLYALHFFYLSTMTDRQPYRDNYFEVAAYKAEQKWIRKGKPKIVSFGTRR